MAKHFLVATVVVYTQSFAVYNVKLKRLTIDIINAWVFNMYITKVPYLQKGDYINASNLIQIKAKPLIRQQIVLKSYLRLNCNCYKKKIGLTSGSLQKNIWSGCQLEANFFRRLDQVTNLSVFKGYKTLTFIYLFKLLLPK